jgi:hypothetical protein
VANSQLLKQHLGSLLLKLLSLLLPILHQCLLWLDPFTSQWMSYHSGNLIDLGPEPAFLLNFFLLLHGADLAKHPLLFLLALDAFLVETLAIVDQVTWGWDG